MTLHCVIRMESVMETFPEVHWPGSLDSVYLLKTIWTLEVFYVLSSVISSQETMFICKLELFILLPCWALCVWWGNYRNSHVIDKTFLPLYISWRINHIMSFVCSSHILWISLNYLQACEHDLFIELQWNLKFRNK